MKRRGFIVTIALVLVFLCVSVQSQADEDLVQNVVDGCKGDLVELCGGVVAGEGRLLECLEKNDSKVSDRCKQAMKDVQVTRAK